MHEHQMCIHNIDDINLLTHPILSKRSFNFFFHRLYFLGSSHVDFKNLSISIPDSNLKHKDGFRLLLLLLFFMHIACRLLRISNQYYMLFCLFVCFMRMPNGIARMPELDIEFRFYL